MYKAMTFPAKRSLPSKSHKKRQAFRQRPKAWVQPRFTKAWAAWVEHEIWHPEQKSQCLTDGRFELVVAFADE